MPDKDTKGPRKRSPRPSKQRGGLELGECPEKNWEEVGMDEYFASTDKPEELETMDVIKFFNAGTFDNPEFGVKIKGRKEDLKTPIELYFTGREAEDFQMRVRHDLDEVI